MPRLRRASRICGTAAAASSRSTVMRTSSEPARDSAAICATVPATSAVSVLVIDCTTIGAPPPTATLPTITWVVLCRALGPATSLCGGFSGLFMASRISGFGDIHQGEDDRRGGALGTRIFYLCFQCLRPTIPPESKCVDGPPALPAILDSNGRIERADSTAQPRLFIRWRPP